MSTCRVQTKGFGVLWVFAQFWAPRPPESDPARTPIFVKNRALGAVSWPTSVFSTPPTITPSFRVHVFVFYPATRGGVSPVLPENSERQPPSRFAFGERRTGAVSVVGPELADTILLALSVSARRGAVSVVGPANKRYPHPPPHQKRRGGINYQAPNS